MRITLFSYPRDCPINIIYFLLYGNVYSNAPHHPWQSVEIECPNRSKFSRLYRYSSLASRLHEILSSAMIHLTWFSMCFRYRFGKIKPHYLSFKFNVFYTNNYMPKPNKEMETLPLYTILWYVCDIICNKSGSANNFNKIITLISIHQY